MGDETRPWQPMSREEFAQLERGQLLRDRRGRAWTVTAEPFEKNLELHVVVRLGDLVRQIARALGRRVHALPDLTYPTASSPSWRH